MLFALFNLTSLEVLSQQHYNFPHYNPDPIPNYVNSDWIPTGLTPTTSPYFAHSFTCKLRVVKNPDTLWEKCGGIFISDNTVPQASKSKFYLQDFTYRAVARTFFNDIAYIPKDALLRLYNRIQSNPTILNGLTPVEKDSVYKFMFPAGKPANNTSSEQLQNLARPGLLVVAGQYTTMPNISCGGANPVRTNAAIYVVDAGSLQPLRMFKFFQCAGDVIESNFTAIRYLNMVDRFVTVGSSVRAGMNNNIDILAFNGDLLYLAWGTLTGTDARTHRYNISEPDLGPSCNDIATGVDLRYFKKPVPQNPIGSFYTDQGAIMVSAYVTNSIGQEISVLLRLNHDGTPNSGRTKNAASNNRAHAVSFLTDEFSIWEEETYDVGVTGYVTVNQTDNIYIAKFDQKTFAYADRRYFTINNNMTEKPGFSIVSTGDGYAVTGRCEQLPLNTNREHLSYLRVENTNLMPIEHSQFPFGPQYDSYGQRMRFDNGSGLMLGGTQTLLGDFDDCSCVVGNPACDCPNPSVNCPGEWKSYAKDPLTVTRTNTTDCLNNIGTYSNLCLNSDAVCWKEMTICIYKKTLLKPKYDVCEELMENGLRASLYDLDGTNCTNIYCKNKIGSDAD
jgi:hypothetical protein